MVTIIMPVSRRDFLDKIFVDLEMLDCDSTKTNLLVVVDGDFNLYVDVRNMVEKTKFEQRLTVHYKDGDKMRNFSREHRRMRIAKINNYAKMYIQECDYIFGIEDDTYFGVGTLRQLLKDYTDRPFAGFIEGVQIGRWGIASIGAWVANDIYDPTEIESVMPGKGLEKIDAGGLYCYITKRQTFEDHDFTDFRKYGLGPDVGFGMALRQQGLYNYIDWSVKCGHATPSGEINLANTEIQKVQYVKQNERWRNVDQR